MPLKNIATVRVSSCTCLCIKSALVEGYSGKPAILLPCLSRHLQQEPSPQEAFYY